MGIVYVVCAVFVALWPEFSAQLMGWLLHLVAIEPVGIFFPDVVYGLIQAVIYTYITLWIFAWLHNRFVKR